MLTHYLIILCQSIPGIAGAIIFLILLVLLVWMICVRATRPKKQEKVSGRHRILLSQPH